MAGAQKPTPRVGQRRLSALVAVTFVFGGGVSLVVDLARGADCEAASITAPVVADTWLDEDSPSATKGSDSVLDVDAGSLNVDTGEFKGRSRSLVRFALPAGVPVGCVVESARLRVFAAEESVGTRVEAVRLASAWTEFSASWSNQPATIGAASTIWSRAGYMQWNVTPQVQAMLDGVNHGFLLRDAAEGTEAGGGHGFYGREKGENPAHVIIQFAPPAPEEDPGPPLPPSPATVSCGQELTRSTLVTNDLANCLGDGLVIGAPRIILDLGGHTIDGTGLGSGIRNEGFESVTVRNGTVQDFDYGVQLFPETTLNVVELLTLRANQVAAVELFDVAASEVRGNTLDQNGGGILLVSGTRDIVVSNNTVTANGGAGLLVRDATANRLEHNSVVGGGDLGISLERASGNTLLGNVSSDNSDGGIEIRAGSHDNHVEGNTVLRSGDHGILLSESDRTVLFGNTAHDMSDSGITLDSANDGVVRGNDVRFNTGGLQLDGSSRNTIEANDASETSGIGIELGGGSLENVLDANTVDRNGAQGIYLADDATDPLGAPVPGLGNVLVRNTASANLSDGIVVAKGGHTLTANVAKSNRGWGINAALVGTIDGGGNVATGNEKPEQCIGVECREEWVAPETTIILKPPEATASSSATFSFTGTDDTSPVAALRFACSLDGAAFTTCVSPRSLTGLAHGPHAFAVRATDRAGNTDLSPATHNWVIDSVPPETTLGDTPPDLSNAATATFTFSGNDEGGGGSSVTFECRLDASGEWNACSSPSEYSSLGEGAHTFAVRATDAAGNADASPATHSWTIDTTPPETTIESGPSDPTNATDADFHLSSSEPAAFSCALDGAEPAPCGPWVTYAGLAEGTHSFAVVATDAAGNADASPATHSWTIDTTPPETTIDAAPADPTNSTSATFEHSANEPATFSCALDGAAPSPCGDSVNYAGLAEGTHSFAVVATDAAGNPDASPATHAWIIETEAPPPSDSTPPETTLSERPADPTNDPSARFTFGGSDDTSEPNALQFECRLDSGDPGDFATCASPADYPGLGAGPHTFEVRAVDAAGNTDPDPARYGWTIDTDPPETSITGGPTGSTRSTSAAVSFTGGDNLAPASELAFACALDDGDFRPCTSPVMLTALAGGSHTFRVMATDRAGNAEPEAAELSWTVDLTAPETRLTGMPANPTNQTSATFTFDGSDDIDDPSDLRFECRLDTAAFAGCTSPRTYPGLTAGSHTFEARVVDAAGNVDPSPALHAWAIDTTPPNTTITGGPAANSTTTNTSASFTFTASEAGSTFQCALDSTSAYVGCSSPSTYTGLSVGTHTFRVRSIDAAGNIDGTPASRTWTIQADTTPPNTTITGGPAANSTTTNSSASFTFTASEAGSTFQCSLDSTSAYTGCTSPHSYAGLPAGSHTFRVRAIDAAGNVDATPASRAWTVESTSGCGQVTLVATADAWIEQNSSTSNRGSDSILKVKSQGPTDNFRALVTFALPGVPADCTLGSAMLRMFAASATSGRTIETLRLNGPWTENGVTWNGQPSTIGLSATTSSGAGNREWNVTTHVRAMYDESNHGFLIRDAAESGSGFEQQFHGREKGEQPPQLILTFEPVSGMTAVAGPLTPASDSGPPALPEPARLDPVLSTAAPLSMLIAFVLAAMVLGAYRPRPSMRPT